MPVLTLNRPIIVRNKATDQEKAEDSFQCEQVRVLDNEITVEAVTEDYGILYVPLHNVAGWQFDEKPKKLKKKGEDD